MTIIYEETGEEGGAEIPKRRVTIRVDGRKVIAEVEPRLLLALDGELALRRDGKSSACGCAPWPTTARSSPTRSRASSRSA